MSSYPLTGINDFYCPIDNKQSYNYYSKSDQIPDNIIEASIRNINRFRFPPQKKSFIQNTIRQTNALAVAREGTGFFKSCSGAVCFTEGDLLPSEAYALLADLREIFRKTIGVNVRPAPTIPEVDDLLYRADWLPRGASICSIPGASLISNPCGRVPR